MVRVASRCRWAPGVLVAAAFVCGMMVEPARAEDEWLVRFTQSQVAALSGSDPIASGVNSFAFGQYAVASGENSMAFGYASQASGPNTTAIGNFSMATGENAMALGTASHATGDNSTGIGSYSNSSGANAVAVGVSSVASGANTTAVGNGSLSSGDNSVAVGVQAKASGANTTALGNHAEASGDNSVAFGVLSEASGDNATAFGNHSKATGTNSTAVGILSKAAGENATALGNQARAIGDGAIAVGTQALATGDNSLALGVQAKATAANSIAIGYGSVANAPNTVSFGSPDAERRLTNIADGIAPTDAATVGQLDRLRSWFTMRIDAIMKKISAIAKLRPTPPPPAAPRGNPVGPSARIAPAPPPPASPASAHKPANGDATATGRADARDARNEQKSAAGVHSAIAHGESRPQPKAAVSGKAVAGRSPSQAQSPKPARNSKVAGMRASDFRSHPQEASIASLSPVPRARTNSSGANTGAPPVDTVSPQRFEAGMASLNARIDDVDTHAKRGIAAATALAPVMMPSRPGRTTMSLGSGFYRGETALSVSIAHSFEASMPVVVYGGYANAAGAEHVGRVGVAVEF